MKTFKVSCYQTEHFTIYIMADSKGDAIRKAYDVIENEGKPKDAEVFERDFDACSADRV